MNLAVKITMTVILVIVVSSLAVADICDPNQIMFRLYNDTNSHVATADQTTATIPVCYDTVFGEEHTWADPYLCRSHNTVLRLSDDINAHAQSPARSSYSTNVCFGDVSCRLTTDSCDPNYGDGERLVITLTGETNAHAARGNDYSNNLCCRVARCGDEVLDQNEQCDLGSQNGVVGSGCTDICTFEDKPAESFVVDIECSINGIGNWESCADAKYEDTINGIRAQCFSWDVNNPVTSAEATVERIAPLPVREEVTLTPNPSTGWLEANLVNVLTVDTSGLWSVNVVCGESTIDHCATPIPGELSQWVVPLGSYFNRTGSNLVQGGCCTSGPEQVQTTSNTRPLFDRYLTENFATNPNLNTMVACTFASVASGCPAYTTPVLGFVGNQVRLASDPVIESQLCCAPELSISVVTGSCLSDYVPFTFLNPITWKASPTQEPGFDITVCAAPKDAQENLLCEESTTCTAGYSCVYSVSSGGEIGTCTDYTTKYCCKRAE